MSEAGDRLRDLFLEGRKLTGEDRQRWLDETCGDDPALRRNLESLLKEDDPGGTLPRLAEVAASLLHESEATEPEVVAGRTIGDFHVLRKLGEGGMGQVFEAVQLSLGRKVALKLLPASKRFDPRSLMRFSREAMAGGRLSHRGIVTVHSVGEADGLHYIAQELIPDGRTLADAIAEAQRTLSTPDDWYTSVARWIHQVAQALVEAHAAGVLHRDVKPSNVLLAEGMAKLADFGLASLHDGEDLSTTGEIVGSPHYMSPEQAAGDLRGLDDRSDVFSLGCTLYEALTLRRPFEGDSMAQVIHEVRMSEPRDPRSVRSRVPADLAVIALRALEKQPAHRYPSMVSMADDLRRYRTSEPILARPAGPTLRARKWVRRHPVVSVSGMVATIALVAIGALLVVANRNAARARSERDNVLRLSAMKELDNLRGEAGDLWLHLADAAALEGWLVRAQNLVAGLEPSAGGFDVGHRRALLDLRRSAISLTELTTTVDGPAVWNPARQEAWLLEQLEALVADLEAFADWDVGIMRGRSRQPMSVRRRRDVALMLAGEDNERLWSDVQKSLEDPTATRYEGSVITRQPDLVPIGRDPDSLLWEFWHPLTGEEPVRGDDGRLRLTETSGVVLVFVPAGSFRMGSPKGEVGRDPREGPQHLVNLSGFLIAKTECTQWQWQRVMGDNPSFFVNAGVGAPVEQVSFEDIQLFEERTGLSLPSETQWEYAARAGTTSAVYTGRLTISGERNAPELDAIAWYGGNSGVDYDDAQPSSSWAEKQYAHTFAGTHVVGAKKANGFGIHDMLGSVWEWCEDWAHESYDGSPADESAWLGVGSELRVYRGGSWRASAMQCRSASRSWGSPGFRVSHIGFRPSRSLD